MLIAEWLLRSSGVIRNLWKFYQERLYNLFTVIWSQLILLFFPFFFFLNSRSSLIAVLYSFQHSKFQIKTACQKEFFLIKLVGLVPQVLRNPTATWATSNMTLLYRNGKDKDAETDSFNHIEATCRCVLWAACTPDARFLSDSPTTRASFFMSPLSHSAGLSPVPAVSQVPPADSLLL